jgi:hypothetical protein
MVEVAQIPSSGVVSLTLRNEEVAGEAALDLHNISFGAKAFDLFFEDDFNACHKGVGIGVPEKGEHGD